MIKLYFQVGLAMVIAILLFSCKLGASGTWKNDNIEQDVREKVKILNDRLIGALKKDDLSGIKTLMSDQLRENSHALGDQVSQVSSVLFNSHYRVLDEYLVKNLDTGAINTLPSGVSADNDYVLNFLAQNKEMYISLLIPNTQKNELLVTAIYGKYGDEWKINILYIGQYSIGGKTAPDYYKTAKDRFQNNELIDAANLMYMAGLCFKPSSIWQYQNADEIKNFGEKVVVEANTTYKFPVEVDGLDTKPKIIGINPEKVDYEFYTVVSYLSTINLKDTLALKSENLKIRREMPKLFKGVDHNKSLLVYRAFNEMPDAKRRIPQFGFIDTLIRVK